MFVHKETIILTDNTIDKSIFLQVGFKNVIQRNLDLAGTASISNLERNNTVMEYLRVIVPRLFQVCFKLLIILIKQYKGVNHGFLTTS